MSRSYCSYNEDWQRRKSVLIRSLFHDIPILSPVEEESNDSYQYAPTQEVFASPRRPYSPLPPLIIERVPVTNKHDEPEEYYRILHRKIKKIYLKLFVEKRNLGSVDYESNYNDSLVNEDNVSDSGSVENLDLKFLESITPGNGNAVAMIQDRAARESSEEEEEEREDSSKSNGYESDCESMDTEMIDIVNYTSSNKEETMRSEREESDINEGEKRNDEFDKARTDNEDTSGSKESSRTRKGDQKSSTEEESHDSTIGDQESEESKEIGDEQSYEEEESLIKSLGKRKIIEDSKAEVSKIIRKERDESTESEESKIEGEQSYDDEEVSNENIDEDDIITKTSQMEELDNVTVDQRGLNQGEESTGTTSDDHELTANEEFSGTENEQQSYNVIYTDLDSNNKVVQSKECEKTNSKDGAKLIAPNVEMMEVDEETNHSSEVPGPHYRQITTAALVHFDGLEDAGEKESQIYEDSVKSVILPTRFRKVTISHHVEIDERIEVLPVLEENADPKFVSTFDSDESETTEEDICEEGTPQPNAPVEEVDEVVPPHRDATEKAVEESQIEQPDTAEVVIKEIGTAEAKADVRNVEIMTSPQQNATNEDIEEMRSHQPDLSQGTIPVTHRSSSESTGNHTSLPQEPTSMTSSTQDGGDRNVSEFKISDDMNEILNSIFNDSRTKDETNVFRRKRKLYVDKSVQAVQASRVSWDEMCSNFFVGTPKIFRLCACNDHICH